MLDTITGASRGFHHNMLQVPGPVLLAAILCFLSGLGRTAPDPAESITTDDGVEIPTGKGIPVDAVHSSLLYNEYPFEKVFLVEAMWVWVCACVLQCACIVFWNTTVSFLDSAQIHRVRRRTDQRQVSFAVRFPVQVVNLCNGPGRRGGLTLLYTAVVLLCGMMLTFSSSSIYS